MPAYLEHPITLASFAQIDAEIGTHGFSDAEYAVVRRVIHTTADFEYQQLMRFSHRPFEAARKAFEQKQPIVTDVSMVAAGIGSVVNKTWDSPVAIAVKKVRAASGKKETATALTHTYSAEAATPSPTPYTTRTAEGMCLCAQETPQAIFAIGNAPTALLALCEGIAKGNYCPALVIGAPVGFINVVESKQALANLAVPHILVEGRKGGSAVAAAILNALMIWTWEQS